eukprot:Gb_20208 [translate_table: standard]
MQNVEIISSLSKSCLLKPDSCSGETGKVEVPDASVGYCISMSAEPSGESSLQGLKMFSVKVARKPPVADNSSDNEDQDDAISDDHARIIWTNLEETTEKIEDIVLADRSFLHDYIVAAVSDPSGQTCTVVKVHLNIDLKIPGGEIKIDISNKKLRRIRAFAEGDYILHEPWLGRVVEVVDNVTISFDDGFKCKTTRDDPEHLMPISKNLLEDTQYPYHPGQHVQGSSSLVFKKLDGHRVHGRLVAWRVHEQIGDWCLLQTSGRKISDVTATAKESATVDGDTETLIENDILPTLILYPYYFRFQTYSALWLGLTLQEITLRLMYCGKMTSRYKNAWLFLLQEMDHLKMIVAKIEVHRPNVLLVEKTISSYAQEYLLGKEISLVLKIKKSLLERIAHCTGAQLLLPLTILLHQKWDTPLGCMVLLKGANDEGATLLELPFRSPITVALPDKQSNLDRAISTISGFNIPVLGHTDREDMHVQNTENNGMPTLLNNSSNLIEGRSIPSFITVGIASYVSGSLSHGSFHSSSGIANLPRTTTSFNPFSARACPLRELGFKNKIFIQLLRVPHMTKPFAFDLSVASNSLVHGAPKRKDLAGSQGTSLQRGENELEVAQVPRHGLELVQNSPQRQEGLEIDKDALNKELVGLIPDEKLVIYLIWICLQTLYQFPLESHSIKLCKCKENMRRAQAREFKPSTSSGRLTSKGEIKCANGKEEEAFKEELGLPRDKGRNEEPKAKKALGHTFSYLSKANVKEEAFVLHLPYALS